ncbi:hypothetical protein [Thauera mechernichensis]
MHRTHKNTGVSLLLKAFEQIDQDMQEAAEHLGVNLPQYDTPQDMDTIAAAFESMEVESAAMRARQVLEEAGREFVAGRMPAMHFLEIERRVKAASDAIARRSARLSPFGGS